MSEPRRMGILNKLFKSKLEEMPSDVPPEDRDELAKLAIDKLLGRGWRGEIEDAGHGMDPTGDDNLKAAMCSCGHKGDDIPPYTKNMHKSKDDDDESGGGIMIRLMKLFNG